MKATLIARKIEDVFTSLTRSGWADKTSPHFVTLASSSAEPVLI